MRAYEVSVVIPVFDDSLRLKNCLNALERQTYSKDKVEIIVVDNNSTENIKDVAGSYERVNLLHEATPGSYVARNKGIRNARGNIIAFTDSDCVPQPKWLEAGVEKLLALENGGFVGGKVEFFFQDPNHPLLVELFDSVTFLQQERYVKEFGWSTTSNMFAFKHVFDDVGLFNHQLKSGGDAEWGKRVVAKGYSFAYAENSVILHPARHSWQQVYKKLKRVSGGSVEQGKFGQEYDSKQKLKALKQLIIELKPPLRLALQKITHSHTMTFFQKAQVYSFSLFVHYVKLFERFRVLMGSTATR